MKYVGGQGKINAKVFIIGEAPGMVENNEGAPFLGRSGALLNEALLFSDFSRNSAFITNLIKIKLPDNRDPSKEEIDKFLPLLKEEIKLVKPKIIITLGRIPSKCFLGNSFKISRDRGIIFPSLDDYFIAPTYHPAFIIRNPKFKDTFFNDIKEAINFIRKK